jgi:hypothetical protein
MKTAWGLKFKNKASWIVAGICKLDEIEKYHNFNFKFNTPNCGLWGISTEN